MKSGMRRLGEFDIAEHFARWSPPLATQILFGLTCTFVAVGTRVAIDGFAPAAGPYSLLYPAILIATLFGRWRAGLVAWAASLFFAWYFVLPAHHSFAFENPQDGPRTIVNAITSFVILVFAEVFRRAVRRAAAERDREIGERDLLLHEIDHRVKNNFSIVAAFLELQKLRQKNEDVRAALELASTRVRGFAAAHSFLYDPDGDAQHVEMRDYLGKLSKTLSDGLFPTKAVRMSIEADSMKMPRDRAAALGLVVSELATNAAKHAFADRKDGEVVITFRNGPQGWRLTVADNGLGMANAASGEGIGAQIIEAFARQAGGAVFYEWSEIGTRATVAQVVETARDAPDPALQKSPA